MRKRDESAGKLRAKCPMIGRDPVMSHYSSITRLTRSHLTTMVCSSILMCCTHSYHDFFRKILSDSYLRTPKRSPPFQTPLIALACMIP